MAIKQKRHGYGLEMRTFKGKKGTYLVFRLPDGAFHAFLETEAKQAARDCGAELGDANTRMFWKTLWDKGSKAK
jgi:hypothetical protein